RAMSSPFPSRPSMPKPPSHRSSASASRRPTPPSTPRWSAWPVQGACSAEDLSPQIDDHGLAHDELLDLARHRHRELLDEADVARHLVVGDTAAAVIADVFLGKRRAAARHDPRAQLLTELLV